ncbi:MAG: Gfo/Idh/MocA family oxidoreductase [Bacteroidetes bacterium]|jgi:predicted dehydrogenase|nr:Gfo/Idh/MocA family oxidoreductase [Bacteroidota bacterium]
MDTPLHIAIVGTRFMGRAHSNAYCQVGRYFDLPAEPIRHVACGRDAEHLAAFAQRFGWEHTETDWRTVVDRDDVDLIDISTPNATHAPIALEAARAGKHLLCEKPMAMNADEARRMYEAAEEAGVVHMMIFNYRFVPALALARRMIEAGKIGRVFHFNAVYYQDWLVDPSFPIVWRHDADAAGTGAHGDMNAHIVDLARHLVGEFEAVNGVQETFIKERPLASGSGTGTVSTDDATSFLARFRNGAHGSFIATRLATGRKNYLRLEIFGSEGALVFNLERLNELAYFSRSDEAGAQGFRTILVTESAHPYIDRWWPPGHIIGWEHTFIHQISRLVEGASQGKQVVPDFYDGLRCQQVLDAVVESADTGEWISIADP